MRVTLVFFLSFILTINSSAQNLFADYGVPTTEELTLTKCDFDPDALAVILKHEGITEFTYSGKAYTHHHYRIKVLREEGISEVSDISIPFFRIEDIEEISMLKAVVINAETNGLNYTPVEKKDFFTRVLTKEMGEIRFAFPNVKVGSILEYEYVSSVRGYNNLSDWFFQHSLPILRSKYMLHYQATVQFTYQTFVNDQYKLEFKHNELKKDLHFEMNNLPGVKSELLMDSRKDYLQRIAFQLSHFDGNTVIPHATSWKMAAKELMNSKYFGAHLDKSLEGTKDFIEGIKSMPETNRMTEIFAFVKQNMSWNGHYGIYSFDLLKRTWEIKRGSSSAINLILINLLRSAGLEAYPVLLSERWNGRVYLDYPFLGQFNTVYALAEISGNKYYLNAADKKSSAFLTPEQILNTNAYVLKGKTGESIFITNDNAVARDYFHFKMKMRGDSISGTVEISSFDYARSHRLNELPGSFFMNFARMNTSEYENKNVDNDSLAYQQKMNFSFLPSTNADYLSIPVNCLKELGINPFIAQNRMSDINFGYKRSMSIVYEIDLPAGYVIDHLPGKVELRNEKDALLYTREVLANEDSTNITIKTNFAIRKVWFTAAEYKSLQYFYSIIKKDSDEMILLKRR